MKKKVHSPLCKTLNDLNLGFSYLPASLHAHVFVDLLIHTLITTYAVLFHI